MTTEIPGLKDLLIDLGYTPKDVGNGYRCANLWRGGDNPNALMVYRNGFFHDFVTNTRGKLDDLIGLTLGTKDISQVQKWVSDRNYKIISPKSEVKPIIKVKKLLNKEFLSKLIQNHDFYIRRGISLETLKSFEGGICKFGSQKNRYLFPIFNIEKELIGFAGRDLTGDSDIKWKITGAKKEFIYPLFLNSEIIKNEKICILAESIGDCLALWDAGIKNSLVLFGTFLSPKILTFLLNANLDKIIIATNNDGGAGNEAAIKIQNKLRKFFDWHRIKISLPYRKDFGEQTKEKNIEWYKQICLK